MPLPTLASIIKFPTITLSVAIALLLCQASAYGQLDDSERAMVAFIDATNAAAEAELIESVNINSGTMNFAGVRAVADHMMPMFEAIGFDARWEDGAAFGRAGHLVAALSGAVVPAPYCEAGPSTNSTTSPWGMKVRSTLYSASP